MNKIVIVTKSFVTGKGGVASYANDFINALKHLFLFTVITGDDYSKSREDHFALHNINLRDLSKRNANHLLDIFEYENPDIIINSYAILLSCVTPFIRDNVKVISISHFTNGFLANVAGFNSKYIDNIISLSYFGKSYLEQKYNIVENKKVCVIYNHVSTKAGCMADSKIKSDLLNIVYPGGTRYDKSADIMCRVLLRLLKTSVRFQFYWLGSTNVTNSMRFLKFTNLMSIIPVDNRVKHIGPVDRVNAMDIISKSNVFILPSRGEGCPMSLIEAMSTGTIPIISDARHGSLEIIENSVSGLIVKKDNVRSLYGQVVDIIENHHKYCHIYKGSYNRFKELFSETLWTNDMLKLLEGESTLLRKKGDLGFAYYGYAILMKTMLLKDYLLTRIIMFGFVAKFLIIYLTNRTSIEWYKIKTGAEMPQ